MCLAESGLTQAERSVVERGPTRIALLFLLPAFVMGLVGTTLILTQAKRPAFLSGYSTIASTHLTQIAIGLQREQDDLKRQLGEARAALDAIQANSAGLSGSAAALQRQIDELKVSAGLSPLNGAGIVVTLDDARLPPSRSSQTIAPAIIHSQDITDVINAAWKGGAQGIAINGERITGSSACVGATIQINGTLLSPPFVIAILGPTETLLRVLGDPLELSDLRARQRAFGLRFDVASLSDVRLPAYTGPLSIRYAQPH